ncbi:MAG: tRNA (adenosine(37)-N6)-dimethylallyltransferase MiaA [Desulfobulbaceae bacterium DB1]|nr:MAG: tRNA (adenosine(37)-N6)-dimethylallyltransferase MiaA [Desulfobulbaceae bacterium DB1]
MTKSHAKQKIIILVGPTAIGKTELSLSIAEDFGCEIVSMDSMQIYRHMDIGTAKPSAEERKRVRHHLLDFVEPDEPYNVARYVEDAQNTITRVRAASHLPMLVGGTGLYMKGLLEGLFDMPAVSDEIRRQVKSDLRNKGQEKLHHDLQQIDPESAERIHPHDVQRLTRAMEIWLATGVSWTRHLARQHEERKQRQENFDAIKIGLHMDRDALYARINSRVGMMVGQGLLREVEKLLAMGFGPTLNSMQSIGYKHMLHFIDGRWSWEEALAYLARDTRRYAKRQLTWFGRDNTIKWFHPDDVEEVSSYLKERLSPSNRFGEK